jgi:hypothetical protein
MELILINNFISKIVYHSIGILGSVYFKLFIFVLYFFIYYRIITDFIGLYELKLFLCVILSVLIPFV